MKVNDEDVEILKAFIDIVVKYENELPPDMLEELEKLLSAD
ncbi:unnamed protein product [marine sediment metagenome]|uniref:Uncharacterized protein n=1 Tax=marine sediment metagenome TaxID=412755 RepID=X0X8N9_9ZZZZ